LIPFWGGALVNPVLEALLGNRTAACVLLFLHCYGEGHAKRIAKTFGFGINMTQRQLKRLEEQGVLVSRRLGNMRLFSFNERNLTVRNLRKLLELELAALPEDDQQKYFRQRQRPRQSNKPMVMHG
jgi:DNA-binding MarR family transcriptional regulator